MDLGTVVREYELQAKSVGVEETAAAARKLGQATDAGAVAVERMNRVQASAAAALDRFAERMNRTYKAQREAERAQDLLNRAQSQGLGSTTAYQRAVEALAERQRALASATAGQAAANDNSARSFVNLGAAGRAAAEQMTPIAGAATGVLRALGPVGTAIAAVAGAATLIANAGDAWTRYGNQLVAAGVSSSTLAETQRDLATLAISSRANLEATVALYARMTRASTDLGVSQQDVRRVTEILGKELANSGLSAAEAAGGLLQFSQGLQSGRFQGDELRSVLENLPGVARAIAREFDTTVGGLRELGSAGELSAERVFRAVLKAGKGIDDAFSKSIPTATQAMENLATASTRFFAEVDRRTGISAHRAKSIQELADAMKYLSEKLEGVGKADISGSVAMLERAIQLGKQDVKFADMRGWSEDAEAARANVARLEEELAKLKGSAEAAAVSARQAADGFGDVARLAQVAASAVAGFNTALRSIQGGIPDVAKVLTAQKEMAELRTLSTQAAADSSRAMNADSLDRNDAIAAAARHADRIRDLNKATEERTRVITGAAALEKTFGDTLKTTTIAGLEGVAKGNAQARESYEARNRQIEDSIKLGMTENEASKLRAQNERILAQEVRNVAAAEAKKNSSSGSTGTDAYDNALQRTRDQIAELKLQEEAASKATLEVYRLTEANRLLRAAKQAGREDEKGIAEEIDRTAEAYARQRLATEQAIEANRKLKESFDFAADSWKSFAEDILTGTDGINGAFKSLGRSFLSSSIDALFNGKGPLSGITGMAPATKDAQGGLLGMLIGLPKAVQTGAEKGAQAGTVDGVVSGFGSFASNGGSLLSGIDNKQLAGGLTAISSLAGAYGAGMSAGSFGQAVGGGAISGLVGGLGLASAGLGSAAVLGPIGLIAGGALAYYGQQQKRKQEREAREKEAQANYKEAQPQIATLGSQFRGEAQNTLAQRLADAEASARKLGDAAFFAGKKSEQDKLYADFVGFRDRTLKEFRDSFGGTIQAINDGLGSDSPFGRSRDAVKAMGETLKTFIADTGTAFGDAAPEVARARESARAYALMVLDGTREMSATATRLQEIKGAATGLQQVLVDLGMAAGDAAAAIDQKTRAAIERLRASFENDLASKVDDAAGRGYLNDLSGLLKEVSTLRTDAASIGADPSLVTSYLQAKAQEIVNSAGLTGRAFEQLLIRFPDLIGVVREAGVVFDDTARAVEAASRKLTYQDRLFAALNDTTTLAGQLAAFDRSAERERAAEIKAGGDAINELEATLAAERLKIITDFATQAAEEQKRALEEAQNFFDSFSRNLREFVDGLKTNASSPLSPQARLAEAQAQYDRQIALARTGDRDAVNNLTSYASSFIEAAKAFYASSSGFQQVFNQVTSDLTALPSQVSAEQFIVDAIKDSRDKLIASIDTNGDGMISLQEATNAGLGSIFSTLDSNGDGQISLLELIRGATTSTSQSTDYGNVLIAQMQGIQNYSNTLQASANYIASTQTSLLDQIRSLNDSSRSTLDALLGQFSLNASLGINGIGLNNNMVTALNKIVYNTAGIWSATVKGPAPAAYAEGGWVRGPGTGTSDSLVARVSNGEFIVNAADAARNRELLETINGGGDLFSGLMMTGFGEAPRPMAIAPANSNEDSGAIVAELRRLYGRIDRLEAQLVAAEYGAAEQVSASVDDVAKETRAARSDARMQRADPRRRSA